MHPLDERRSRTRHDMRRPCKVYDPLRDRYVAGTTWDVSERGACIEAERRVNLQPGDRLFFGVALRRREVLLPRREMTEATVVRTIHTPDGRTVIAMRLESSLELRLAA